MRALCLLFVLAAAPVWAEEPTPFRWPSHEGIPQRISDVGVAVNLGWDAWESLYQTDARTRWAWACRLGVTTAIKQVTGLLIPRTRPNGSDRHSFFSAHTAYATVAAGYRPAIGASVALTVGWGRMAGGMHYGSDVAVGVGVGILAQQICH